MKMFTYTAKDEASHKSAGAKLRELPEGEYLITVKKNRPIRSLSANKFFHAIIKVYATHTGHHADEIDNMFRMARHYEIIEYPSGKNEKIPKRTSNLDTKEFAAVVNNLLQWGQDEFPTVKVLRKEDLTYQMWMEIENDYERTFSGF